MLFWTWNEMGAEEYDRDKQETKLTLIISIARDVWPTLTTDELKTEMIALIFLLFLDLRRWLPKDCILYIY